MQPPQGYGPPPPSQGYGQQGNTPQGSGPMPGYPPPKRGLSAPLIIAIIFGCLFSGCVGLVLLGRKVERDEKACNADPACKAEKAAKAEKEEEEAKARQAAKEAKSAADTKAKAEKADQAAKAGEQKAAEEKAATEKAAALVALPESEKKFCSTVASFAKDYKDAPSGNELKRSKVRGDRRQALSALPPNAADWIGTITELSTTGDGKAVLGVKLPCDGDTDVKVKTWNNAVSDMLDHSLIAQTSKTYATLSELGKGKQIRFAGTFVTGDDKNGIRESSLSERGSMTDPEFIFRFSQVSDARTATPPPGSAAASAPTATSSDFDAIGAEKEWGDIHATLKEAAVKGNVATASILLKNTQATEEHISSLMQIQVTNEEGDKGEMDFGRASCDGTVPPNGVLKCKLAYTFAKPPTEVTIALGAGLGAATVYFKYKPAK
jgi:hypothetical protein